MKHKYIDFYVEGLKNVIDKRIGSYNNELREKFNKAIIDKYFWRRVIFGTVNILVCKRNAIVSPDLIDKRVLVYNGKRLRAFVVRDYSFGYKFGEFFFSKFIPNRFKVHERRRPVKYILFSVRYFNRKKKVALEKKEILDKKQRELEEELDILKEKKNKDGSPVFIDLQAEIEEKFKVKKRSRKKKLRGLVDLFVDDVLSEKGDKKFIRKKKRKGRRRR